MSAWPRERIERVMALVNKGMPYPKIARLFGVTTNAVSGLVFRERHKDNMPKRPSRAKAEPFFHVNPNLTPAKVPFAPDCSCPDFAWDDQHVAAVYAARADGFPVAFSRPHYRLRAA